ncbi:MAG: MBL fold metallo-hydrolase [Nocardioides sp.]|nr:MBL fold metallo-hydrolase [Nocardioides sp.]
MTSPILTFLGAVGTVTGSRFLVEGRHGKVLVDAGLFQGVRSLRQRNWDDPPLNPAELDAVVLTHAHLDHSGYLPKLVRGGFAGPVICTPETAALVEIVLRDSAHLQSEDAAYANRTGFSKHAPALPLYDESDVDKTLPLLTPTALRTRGTLAPNLTVSLRPSGHILGSAIALISVDGATALFSGDLGRPHHPLLDPPAEPPAASAIVVESTYGDRTHPEPNDEILASAVRRTVARGGTVLVPAFAVDRTELVLLELHRLRQSGRIPPVAVYVDSPMALASLEVHRRAARTTGALQGGCIADLFDLPEVHPVREAAESMSLNSPSVPCILVSASGMASGGRVVHHLRHQLPDPRNTVVLTGYQAEGTRGRQLANGARTVKMHGRYVPVRADIVQIPDFSVHADADEIIAWLGRAPRPPRTAYVVHGEPASSAALARRIRDELGWCAATPRYGERVRLD